MEDEFEFLYRPSDNANVLGTFRTALGTKATFPAIESFLHTMEDSGRGVVLIGRW